MSKYGDLIQKARNEGQNSGKPESQKTGLPENLSVVSSENKTSETEANDQGAGKPENQLSGLPENQTSLITPKEEDVNLSIKVSKRLRRHWVAEAKRRDSSLTAIIIASLKDTLGEPDD